MRFLGWLATGLGLVGVLVCNGIAPLFWVLRANLRARARDVLAIPDVGLKAALTVTDSATTWLGDASTHIAAIGAEADRLVRLPAVDADATTELASAIGEFVSGPYATLRSVYAGLRDRAIAVSDALQGLRRAVPVLSLPAPVAERLAAIDARMEEIDAEVTTLGAMRATDLAAPGVAATVSERATLAAERLETIGTLVTEVEAWLHESQERVAAADRRAARLLTVGALAGTALSLAVAGLNVLLFQQGRRWSRR